MARVITIASGQDGVGKTSIGVNLALYLSQCDKRVCLFDAVIGLETVKSLLGLKP
ncbi:MAG: P-loop NTPase, partial [Gammaproteobacteria bacterium]